MESNSQQLHYGYKQFIDEFSNLSQEKQLVGVFLAAKNADGKYWCPQCEDSKDAVNNVLLPKAKEANVKTVFVDVGDKTTWRNQDHPLRQEGFNIRGVPTIAYYTNGKVQKTLVEEDCTKADDIRKLF